MTTIKISRVIEFFNEQKNAEELKKLFDEFINKTILKLPTDNTSKNKVKETCKHELVKGKLAGTKCTTIATMDGYCKKHMKKESKETKEKKTCEKEVKETVKKVKKEKKENNLPKVIETIKKPTIVIGRNEYGNYEHTETGFVFKRTSENLNVVIGKQVDNEVVDLDEDDLILCNKYGFNTEDTENY